MKTCLVTIVCMIGHLFSNAQLTETLGAQNAFRTSEFIRAIPQESNGYLVMHENNLVDYWKIDVINEDVILHTFMTEEGENHLRLDAEIYTDLSNSYQIQGKSNDGTIIIDFDIAPIDGVPEWVLNDCNRPTCVKTSGVSNYAYSIKVFDHINNYDNDPYNDNNAYKLRLSRAYTHVDPSSGIQIPYYVTVSSANLSTALQQQGYTYQQGTTMHTYFPDGNGNYKVALNMGDWIDDNGASTNQINGLGGEGCSLTFATALNKMNAYATLLTPLSCNGQYFSQNEPGGGSDNPIGTSDYANASTGILNCSALFSNTTYNIDYHYEEVTNEDGIISYILVLNVDGTNINLDCDETIPGSNPNSPCPPGYYYSPGGGDPCKPIEPIRDQLQNITITPIDVNFEGEETPEDTIEPGLYLVVLNYENSVSIPLYRKIEEQILLGERYQNNANRINISPNPTRDNLMLSVSKNENILSYKLVDTMGNPIAQGDFSSKSDEQILDITDLQPGAYFLTIKTDVQIYTEKIMKR